MANKNHRVAEVRGSQGEVLYAVVITEPSWERRVLGAIDRPHGSLTSGQGPRVYIWPPDFSHSQEIAWLSSGADFEISGRKGRMIHVGGLIKVLTNKGKQPPARFWRSFP